MTDLLTTREVASETGWSIAKVRHLIAVGKLPAVNTSTGDRPRWAVRVNDLQDFLTPTVQSGAAKCE